MGVIENSVNEAIKNEGGSQVKYKKGESNDPWRFAKIEPQAVPCFDEWRIAEKVGFCAGVGPKG